MEKSSVICNAIITVYSNGNVGQSVWQRINTRGETHHSIAYSMPAALTMTTAERFPMPPRTHKMSKQPTQRPCLDRPEHGEEAIEAQNSNKYKQNTHQQTRQPSAHTVEKFSK
eukprot:4770745-Amphidinium_carterae.1